MTTRNLLSLLFLGAMFGASFLYMRVAAPEVGPWVVAFMRVGVATIALALVVRRPGLRRVAAEWRPLFLLGAVNTALPFGMYAFAETTLTASLAAINKPKTKRPMRSLFTTILDGLTFKDIAGKRHPRTYTLFVGILLFFMLVIGSCTAWEQDSMMDEVRSTPKPVQVTTTPWW